MEVLSKLWLYWPFLTAAQFTNVMLFSFLSVALYLLIKDHTEKKRGRRTMNLLKLLKRRDKDMFIKKRRRLLNFIVEQALVESLEAATENRIITPHERDKEYERLAKIGYTGLSPEKELHPVDQSTTKANIRERLGNKADKVKPLEEREQASPTKTAEVFNIKDFLNKHTKVA